MKKLYHSIVAVLLTGGLCLTASCTDKFDEYNTDRNATTKPTAAMLATQTILDLTRIGGNQLSLKDNMRNKQIAWSEAGISSDQYNDFGTTGFGDYLLITNCDKMVLAAATATDEVKNSYQGLAKFAKAYLLFNLSLRVGDIPYSDSNFGESGGLKPKYDTQKEVMLQVLEDLDEAKTLFSNGAAFTGDPIFSGDVAKWKKTVAAMQLKVLINLSLKTADTDLNVKARFAAIAGSSDLMSSNADNFQLVYSDQTGQQYPLYKNNHAPYAMITTTMVEPLKAYEDYRLFYYAAPSTYQLGLGLTADSFDAYLGIDPAAAADVNRALNSEGKYCALNARYLSAVGEPLARLSYMEQNFILAEAALLGWIDSSKADEYYKKGIRASMEFVAANTADNEEYHHNRKITSDYIDTYLSRAAIQLNGTFEHDREMVLLQKYLAFYLQHPNDEMFFDNRRTGYPVLPVNPDTNMNADVNALPLRWRYSEKEAVTNKDNLKEALERQYGGSDENTQTMWILK